MRSSPVVLIRTLYPWDQRSNPEILLHFCENDSFFQKYIAQVVNNTMGLKHYQRLNPGLTDYLAMLFATTLRFMRASSK